MSSHRVWDPSAAEAVQVSRPQLKQPPMYRVVVLDDDYTPMDFVVKVLELYFEMNREKAVNVMLQIHNTGKATCGIYTRDVAITKIKQVTTFVREHQYPLLCSMELN